MSTAPPVSAVQLFVGAWAALALCAVPVVLLQQIDAFLAFTPWPDLARDVALLVVGSALPAAVLALMSALLWRLTCGRAKLRAAWLVYGPVAFLCIWQFARMGWLWVKQVSGHQFLPPPSLRYALMLGCVLCLMWLLRRASADHWLRALHDRLFGLRLPLALAFAAALLTLLAWPFPAAQRAKSAGVIANRPDVIIITVDALAGAEADWCNPKSALMPRTAAFIAAQMHCHARFYAASNFTTPATSTLETGLLPWTHQANQIHSKVAPAWRGHTLAQALSSAGYRSLQTTDNHLASPRHRATHAGYETASITPSTLWRDRMRAALTFWPESSLPALVDSALSFLGAFDKQIHATDNPFDSARVFGRVEPFLANDADGRPAFVWVHAMPPHGPYLPPPSTKYKRLPPGRLDRWSQFIDENTPYSPKMQSLIDQHRERYRESVMATDDALADLLVQLQRNGRLDRAILVLSADHGESFERGYFGHAGPMLHEALIRIPFAVRLPGQREARVWQDPASQADLAPSLLELLSLPPLPKFDGRSLAGLWQGRPFETQRPVFSMAMERQSRFAPLRDGHYVVIDGEYKLHLALRDSLHSLYRLGDDPLELRDLSKQLPDRALAMRKLLLEQLQHASESPLPAFLH